jgi:CBS domain-containing protein
MSETCSNDTLPRPSPFGPARILVPENQQVICIPSSTAVSDALRKMIDANFSQLPVIDQNKRIIGIFSYRSLGERVYELQDKIALSTLPVSECLEPAKFLGPDDYVDTSTAVDFYEDDYVIVGAPDDVLGILSVADVFVRLNDFAEAFVLLHETELGLRRLIEQNLGPEGVSAALEAINTRNRQQGAHGRPLMTIEDCEFHHYIDLVTSKSNWRAFEKSFPTATRELINRELVLVNNIRNDVVHFRRQITRADTVVLKRFRDRLKRE